MASPNVPGVAEVQLRMNKKIAELTKIIYNLNNRVDDPEVDLQDVADEYGAEMEQILRDTAASVSTFNGYMGMPRDEGKAKDIQKLEATLEAERLKWQKELETVRQRNVEKEVAIQKAASKQIQSLSLQVEQLQGQLCNSKLEVEKLKQESSMRGVASLSVAQTQAGGTGYVQLQAQLTVAQAKIRAVELNSQGPQLIQELSQTQAHLSDAQHDLSQARKELSEKDRQIQLLQQEMSALKSK